MLSQILTTLQVSTVLSLTMLHIIPLICLAYLNYAIFWAIRLIFFIKVLSHFVFLRSRGRQLGYLGRRQRRDLVVASVLISIVGVFIICHSLKFVINMVELWIVIKGDTILLAFLSEILSKHKLSSCLFKSY